MKRQNTNLSKQTPSPFISKTYNVFAKIELPSFEEKVAQGGLVKWGANNLAPQELVSLAENNPIHGGIIEGKKRFLTQGGLVVADPKLKENEFSPYSLEEIFETSLFDSILFNGYALLFKKRKFANGSIEWYFHESIDFELLRSEEDLIYYQYSENWGTSVQNEKTGFRRIKSIFKVDNETDDECVFYNIKKPKQSVINVNKRSVLTKSFYPKPSYMGAIPSIKAGTQQQFFTLAEVTNGYKGGTLINLNNGKTGSEEGDEELANSIREKATDPEKGAGIVVSINDGKENEATIQQINGNDTNKRYIESSKEIRKEIMIGHQVISQTMFSVLSENMFGSQEEMTIAYELLVDGFVKPMHKFVLDGAMWAYEYLNKRKIQLSYNIYAPAFIIKQTTAAATETKMSKEFSDDDILEMFAKCGVSKSEFFELKKQEFGLMDDEAFIGTFDQFMSASDEMKTILTMIKNGETYQAVYKAIGKDGAYLSKKLVDLGNKGLIEDWKVTDEGRKLTVTKADLKVLYSYGERPNAPKLIGESRDFCKKLLDLDRLYTKAEIDTISTAIGRDVWYYRGGWYHNPETDVNTPSCRHIWYQKIVSNL